MSDDNLTIHLLRGLREELHSTRDELRSELRSKIGSVNQRIDRLELDLATTRDQLGHRILESELRIATRIAEQTAATRDLYDLLNANLQLRDRVERCEQDIAELEERGV